MCEFSISFNGEAEGLISQAKQQIQRAGGSLTGDALQGNFFAKTPIGSIYGSYTIVGQQIVITITKKPMLLSCKRIEKELSEVMR